MEFGDYVRILRKRWWVVVVAVVLTAGSAYAFGVFQYPEYTSTVEVVILPARPDLGLAQSAKMLLRTYMTVADSDRWAQEVIDELQLPMTPEKLHDRAYFAAEADRMVIRIEVKDYDGDQADRITSAWAQRLIDWRNERNASQSKEDRVYAELRDYPTHSQSWPPGGGILLAAGGVFGLVVAGMVIFFLEWIEASTARIRQGVGGQELAAVGAILRRRWWIVVVAVALTTGGAFALATLRHPQYTSTAEVIIEPERPEWGLTQSAKMLLYTYMTLIDSRRKADEVVAALPFPATPEDVLENSDFTVESDRMVIRIEVEDDDGDQANIIAAGWAQQLIDWRNEKNALQRKEDRVYATLRDYPTYSQSWPPGKRTVLVGGGVLGLALAGAVIFVLEWLEVDAASQEGQGAGQEAVHEERA